jgi:ATP-dependent RNA helicase RhlE
VDNVEWRLNRASQKKQKGTQRRKTRCAEAIHSGRSQRARERALDKFKKGTIQVLVATDIAARGIDVEDIDLVVNFDFPKEPEIYIHRIGRTGRAGAEGIAISFCSRYDRPMMRQIELLIKQHIEVVHDNPFKSEIPAPYPTVIDPKERAKNLAKSRRLRRRR